MTNEYSKPIRAVPYSHLTSLCVVYFQELVTNEYSEPTGRYHTVI